MVFTSNPLSLSVPDPFFESWLRDNGYPEIIDQHTSTAITTSSAATADAASITNGFFISLFSRIFTLFSLFTINPFSKLTNDDLAAQTPPWTTAFFGSSESYSFPLSVSQARMRVQENVKRYARNYATLFVLFFACSLYQMPLALVGLISCLALWDVFKFCSERWGLDQYPIVRQCLIRFAQCVAAVILICSNVQMAIFCALTVSYAVCGQRLSSVVGRNYSVSPTGEVNTLKEEVTTLKGQLAAQDEQIKAQSEQMRAQSEHIKAENEQMRAQMSMIVQALAVSGLQIQLPAPDLTPPSTSQPPHLPDTQ